MRAKQLATVVLAAVVGFAIGGIVSFFALLLVVQAVAGMSQDPSGLGWVWILVVPACIAGGIAGSIATIKFVYRLGKNAT